MKRHLFGYIFVSILLLVLTNCTSLSENENGPKYLGADTNEVETVTAAGVIPTRQELEQGWNNKTRMNFWFTSQGSRILPYNWFTWLEQADNQTLFRDVSHMEQLRYLPFASSSMNPAGLPIGFALDKDQINGTAWVGLTCAACHTNQVDYQGTKMLVEGAPTLANFVLFYSRLVAALEATNQDDAKFTRFAKGVLGEDYSEKVASKLHQQLLAVSIDAAERQQVNSLPSDYPGDFTSYARLDAFGNIQNAGTAFALHDLNNKNVPDAPVSYPFLWGTHQSDVVQWNASAPNTPVIGPLVRNIGEVVGVFGGLSIVEASERERAIGIKVRYSSSIDLMGLGNLEAWVKILRSPQWPEEHLPSINATKAAQGEALFEAECKNCHQIIARVDEGNKYISVKTPVTEVGTDPAMALNAVDHQAKTLILQGVKDKILIGSRFGETAAALDIPVNGVVGVVLRDPAKAIKAGRIAEKIKTQALSDEDISLTEEDISGGNKSVEDYLEDHFAAKSAMQKAFVSGTNTEKLAGLVYKARPLNGIWATAPFLHNGSVPSLWDLLQLPENRPASFWVGSREFDPVNVGYVSDTGLSLFNVHDASGQTIAGNANSGHDYGTTLTDQQKWELVEFMKTL